MCTIFVDWLLFAWRQRRKYFIHNRDRTNKTIYNKEKMHGVGWATMITNFEGHAKKGVLGKDRNSAFVAARETTLIRSPREGYFTLVRLGTPQTQYPIMVYARAFCIMTRIPPGHSAPGHSPIRLPRTHHICLGIGHRQIEIFYCNSWNAVIFPHNCLFLLF